MLNVEIPWTSGYASSLQNFGSVSNKGFELGLKTKNLNGHFVWNTDLNFSFNRNKVLTIGTGAQSYISGNYIIKVGEPLGTFYGTKTDGILQKERNPLKVYLREMLHQKPEIVFIKILTVMVNLLRQMIVPASGMHSQILFLGLQIRCLIVDLILLFCSKEQLVMSCSISTVKT